MGFDLVRPEGFEPLEQVNDLKEIKIKKATKMPPLMPPNYVDAHGHNWIVSRSQNRS